MHIIDLRSDTITQPTDAMRRAMAEAVVGDDVFGEDPTVNQLEESAAICLGKQAGLFVPSGTMGNLASVLAHCNRGDEVILGDKSHIVYYEQGGVAAMGGVHPRTVLNQPDGTLGLDDIRTAVRSDDIHFPRTRLIALENTHNNCGGVVLDTDYLQSVRKMADAFDLKIHVDGARIFNASAALNTDVRHLAAPADSISFCLSKGLCAPAGSIICGSREFIARARRMRKVLGGGMRQAGILAAAGLIALNDMTKRLHEDHENARILAEGLAEIPNIRIDPNRVKTNILYFEIPSDHKKAATLPAELDANRVRILNAGPNRFRAVTHHPLTRKDMDAALMAFHEVLG